MTSILFLTDAIYCNIFRCNYDRNEKYFRSFLLHFLNLHSILNIFKEKMTLIADLFLNWQIRNTSLEKCLKTPASEDPLTIGMVIASKDCWNLNDSTDSLLTHWRPMTSILFLTEAIYSIIYKCNYLSKEKYFLNFFYNFLNVDFWTYGLRKTWLDICLKSPFQTTLRQVTW